MTRTSLIVSATVALASLALSDLALAQGVSRINADDSASLLGDGTGVVVGVLDTGVDATHPLLTGNDSQGNSRLVAEGNFVSTEPGFSPDDVHGHGTGVAGVVMGQQVGVATDARLINSRVIDSNNSFQTTNWVLNGAGFAVDNGADVMNLSLNTFGEFSNGSLGLDRMIDFAAVDRDVISAVCAGNISSAAGGDQSVRSPAGGYNSIAVGWTSASFNYNRLHPDSSFGPTSDGRIKPNVVAPGHNIVTFSDDWETGSDFRTWSGCSFATPHVAGLLAQQIDYGRTNGLDTDPLGLKATLLNSADKNVFDRDGNAWESFDSQVISGVFTVDGGLDEQLGAGQVDGIRLFEQYSAGEQDAGTIDDMGWDIGSVTSGDSVEYEFTESLQGGTSFTATLTWFRDVDYVDDGNGIIDSLDQFNASTISNLNLSLMLDGQLVATANSLIDNVEHIHFDLAQSGDYTLVVERVAGVGPASATDFGLAWWATAIPEPSATLLVLLAGFGRAIRRRRNLAS
jgi:hypothetical protein